jgi:hypothetical protein
MPNADFIPELLELYPDLKIVLVTRNPDKWWESMQLNLKYGTPWFLPILTFPYPCLRWFPQIESHWRKNAMKLLEKTKGNAEVGPGEL